MIKAKRKPLDEIYGMVKDYSSILIAGCGGCTSVCLAGGQPETLQLSRELKLMFSEQGKTLRTEVSVIERQCSEIYIKDIEDLAAGSECIVSAACGTGVQLLAEKYGSKPVFPALNTMFAGIDRGTGLYEEKCRSCGDCRLGYTAGICPVTCCSKSLFNGPCGGTAIDGSCEVNKDTPCAWNGIYERLKAQGRLENIMQVHPPMNWTEKGPATLVQHGYEKRYARNKRD